MRRLTRFVHAIWALVLAAAIVLPALPRGIGGQASSRVAAWMKKISVAQHWGMYAPNPQRSQMYMNLTAAYADGSTAELEETAIEEAGWGTIWAWRKTRKDVWRHYANMKANKGNRNRDWYLRGVCVREARTDRTPRNITMTVVRRRFRPPRKVRAGQAALGPPKEKLVQVLHCNIKSIRKMIEADRERNG